MTKNKTPNLATKDDVRKIVLEATDAILSGMDEMLKNLATKEEIKRLVTKEDLKEAVDTISSEIEDFPSREEVVLKKDLKKIYANV